MRNMVDDFFENLEIKHIINDNKTDFFSLYKKNMSCENKPLALFCAENGAISILSTLFQDYKHDIKKLHIGEKRIFIKYILNSNYFLSDEKESLIFFWLTHYTMSQKAKTLLLLECLKYGSHRVIQFLISQGAKLNSKYFLELIMWVKAEKMTAEHLNIIASYITQVIEDGNTRLYKLLSLNISETNGYCLEIDIFDRLTSNKQQDWYKYMMKGNRLKYHIHSEQNNENDNLFLNMEFLYLLTYYLIVNQSMNIHEIKKIKNLMKDIERQHQELNEQSLVFLLNEMNKVLLKQQFDKEMKESTITTRINKI